MVKYEHCRCDKGGECFSRLHAEGKPCGKKVKITANSRHTVCKSCRSAGRSRVVKGRKSIKSQESVEIQESVKSQESVEIQESVIYPPYQKLKFNSLGKIIENSSWNSSKLFISPNVGYFDFGMPGPVVPCSYDDVIYDPEKHYAKMGM